MKKRKKSKSSKKLTNSKQNVGTVKKSIKTEQNKICGRMKRKGEGSGEENKTTWFVNTI